MYRSVDLEQHDRPQVIESAGLALTTKNGVTFFRQPCTAFGDGRCSIYEDRPGVCRWYRCLLFRRHEAGEVGSAEAAALVAGTIAMRDRVRSGIIAYLGTEHREPLRGLYRRMLAKFEAEPDPAAARREHSELLFAVVALRAILAREFEPRDSTSHVPEAAGGVGID
jgi:Fe-S-cluster containining protein